MAILFMASYGDGATSSRDRRIKRFVQKTFDTEEITLLRVDLPDSNKVFPDNQFFELKIKDSLIGYMGFNRANSCRVGGCVVYDSTAQGGAYDPFFFGVIYHPNLEIRKIKILEYFSDFGYEISSKRWLRQFEGKSGCEADFGKRIDGISGATISVKSLIQEIETNCTLYGGLPRAKTSLVLQPE